MRRAQHVEAHGHLFGWQPDARQMDYYERGLYNTILGTQDPDSGGFTYFNSLKPGHFKIYSTPFDAMWCCVGSGMESHSKYADTIYSHDADTLWVNLFIPSELNWQAKGVTIRQETEFPNKDITTITALRSRSRSCRQGPRSVLGNATPQVTVNGEKQTVEAKPQSYLTLSRTWKDGDTIKVQFPMGLRLQPARDDKSRVVVMYGPLVLAGELGREGMPDSDCTGNNVAHPGDKTPPVPVLVDASADPFAWLKRDPRETLRSVSPAWRSRGGHYHPPGEPPPSALHGLLEDDDSRRMGCPAALTRRLSAAPFGAPGEVFQ